MASPFHLHAALAQSATAFIDNGVHKPERGFSRHGYSRWRSSPCFAMSSLIVLVLILNVRYSTYVLSVKGFVSLFGVHRVYTELLPLLIIISSSACTRHRLFDATSLLLMLFNGSTPDNSRSDYRSPFRDDRAVHNAARWCWPGTRDATCAPARTWWKN